MSVILMWWLRWKSTQEYTLFGEGQQETVIIIFFYSQFVDFNLIWKNMNQWGMERDRAQCTYSSSNTTNDITIVQSSLDHTEQEAAWL